MTRHTLNTTTSVRTTVGPVRTRGTAPPRIPPTPGRSRPEPASILARTTARAHVITDRAFQVTALLAPLALRVSLGLIFVWFGALKIAGVSPVAALVSATLPWADPATVVPLLGVAEVVLGAALLAGKARRLVLTALAAHLTGTFLSFVTAPQLTVHHGDPLLLTAEGEFVLKNLALISAALLLASITHGPPDAAAGR